MFFYLNTSSQRWNLRML